MAVAAGIIGLYRYPAVALTGRANLM